jgi:hypothetical protein
MVGAAFLWVYISDVEVRGAERLLGEHCCNYVYIFLIDRGIVNINIKGSQKEAQPIGLGKVRKYRNYGEDLHPLGVRYTPTSTLGCHSMYIWDKFFG